MEILCVWCSFERLRVLSFFKFTTERWRVRGCFWGWDFWWGFETLRARRKAKGAKGFVKNLGEALRSLGLCGEVFS